MSKFSIRYFSETKLHNLLIFSAVVVVLSNLETSPI